MDIDINGTIILDENPVSHEEFLNSFIKFIESNNWRFAGITKPSEDDKEDE